MSIRKISPKYESSKLDLCSVDDLIDIYEDRVRGWLINCGYILNNHEHAGFGVLQIGLAYFEGFTVFFRGKDSSNRSKEFFREGLESTFTEVTSWSMPIRDAFVEVMYKNARCGLFHLGMVRRRIVLSDGQPVFRIATDPAGQSIETIFVDRHGFIKQIDQHHSAYVARLRDTAEVQLRSNFDQAWALVHL